MKFALHIVSVLVCLFALVSSSSASGNAKVVNPLACRVANYYKYQDEAFEHMARCGFKYVFMNIVAPEDIEKTQKKLDKYDLTVAVFRGDTDLSRDTSLAELEEQLQTCKEMGVKYMFLSPKHKTISKEVAIAKLKKLGPIAAKYGVIVGLETHPDLGTNGQVHLETMKAINHPNIRVNFDSANITYYNQDTTAEAELEKCIDYVGTFEFKDHSCKFKDWDFPALGKGKVAIKKIMKMLSDHGYEGPITLEIEGREHDTRTKGQVFDDIEESYRYIQSLR
jgi:sugar phosphate isomerase/epimerase